MGYQPGYRERRRLKDKMKRWRASRSTTSAYKNPLDNLHTTNSPIRRRRSVSSVYRPLLPGAERREKRGCVACCLKIEPELKTGSSPLDFKTVKGTIKPTTTQNPLAVSVDEVLCGIGGGRSAVRLLNNHKRKRTLGDDDFFIISALDGNVQKRRKRTFIMRLDEKDLSSLGKGQGVVNGATSNAFIGFFNRLKVTRSVLVIIEEVDAILHKSNQASFLFIVRNLEKLGYHWRVRILDSSKYGAAQQRKRAYLVCALDSAVISAFVWPSRTRKARSSSLVDALLPPGNAHRTLFLNPKSKLVRVLSHPENGLPRPVNGKVYSRVASVFRGTVHLLSSARSCVATITASRSSGLYMWENQELRHLAGEEALRLFSFTADEVEEFTKARMRLKISSLQLAEMTGDSFVVTVVAKLMRALVDAFSAIVSDEEKEQWSKKC